jgi:hypothetical protein
MFPTELNHFQRFYHSANFYANAPLRDLLDVEKARALRAVHPYTRLTWGALSSLYDAARSLERERIAGAVVACGAGVGGSSALLSSVAESIRGRDLWVFDPSLESAEAAEALFRKLYLNPRRKHFQPELPRDEQSIGPIALLHLNGAQACLGLLYDQVTPGGFIFVDGTDRRQLSEFLASRGGRAELRKSHRDLAFFRKH